LAFPIPMLNPASIHQLIAAPIAEFEVSLRVLLRN